MWEWACARFHHAPSLCCVNLDQEIRNYIKECPQPLAELAELAGLAELAN